MAERGRGGHSGGNGHSTGGNGHATGGAVTSTRGRSEDGRGSLYGVQIDRGQDIGVLRGRSGPVPAADPAHTHRFSLAQHPQFLLTYSDDMPQKLKLRKRVTAWPLQLTLHAAYSRRLRGFQYGFTCTDVILKGSLHLSCKTGSWNTGSFSTWAAAQHWPSQQPAAHKGWRPLDSSRCIRWWASNGCWGGRAPRNGPAMASSTSAAASPSPATSALRHAARQSCRCHVRSMLCAMTSRSFRSGPQTEHRSTCTWTSSTFAWICDVATGGGGAYGTATKHFRSISLMQ